MLYATIVQRKIKRTFREINQGNVQPMLDTLADPFVYVFHGTHALGGRRTSKDAMRLWWERVFRLTTWYSIRRSKGCDQRVSVEYARCS